MAATDARPVPRKNTAYRVTFPILDADGDLVTGAATLDSEVSIDAGTFADCTNEATEIATSSGIYYLDLTAAEMNGDTIAVIVKTGTAGAKTTTIVMYPEEAGDYRADVVQWNGTTVATPTVAGVPEVDVTHFNGVAGTFASGRPEVNTTHAAGTAWGSGAITAASIAASALNGKGDWNVGKTGYALSAAGIQAVWDALTSALTTVGSIGKLIVDNLNATISSRSSHSAADVWASATRTLTSAANITSTGGTTVPQTGDSFARLGAPVGASISADIAGVQSDTNDIQTRIPAALVGGRMDSNLGAISTSATAADNLERSTLGIVTGTVGAASTTTSIVTSALSPAAAVIDQFKGRIVTFDSATTTANLRGQSTDITSNTAAGVLTVTALTTAPVSGDTFTIT